MKRTYWYKFHWAECPVCGKNYSYKERIYDTPKPDKIELRHIYEEYYDHCEGY